MFHDNGIGNPEQKFIHDKGREAIYDGDTGGLVTDPDLRGTFNYVPPEPFSFNPLLWDDYIINNGGHILYDVLPYILLGNDRPDGLFE